jgi:hypothetical protein
MPTPTGRTRRTSLVKGKIERVARRPAILQAPQRSFDVDCRLHPVDQKVNVVAHEYPIYGHFQADLIVGDSSAHEFLLIEFEDGASDSIFKKVGSKATLEWSRRFEHAFSQIVDWMWKLEDMRSSQDFQDAFGSRSANFHGLVVIGRDPLAGPEKARLKWRTDRVLVDSHKISSMSCSCASRSE